MSPFEERPPGSLDLHSRHSHNVPPESSYVVEETTYSNNSKLALCKIPRGAWDSHMHVVDPKHFPLALDARYVPASHLLKAALEVEARVGIDNIVLVQPSIYGNDNSCLLSALERLGLRRGRGVVAFDPSVIDVETLRSWHKLGVRGVRVNFQSIGKKVDEKELEILLLEYADLIRPFDWVLQLYIPLSAMVALERIIAQLRVRVCLDHFGSPSMTDLSIVRQLDPFLIPGFSSLARLLEGGDTYVKLSAPYRFCRDLGQLESMTKTLLSIADGRKVVFGTDWPHTRYEGLDITPFVQVLLDWCGGDVALVEKVFRDNAAALWNVV